MAEFRSMNKSDDLPQPTTPGAGQSTGYGGFREGFRVGTPSGARAVGHTHNSDFPNEKGSPTRGELFYTEVPKHEQGKGLGTSLSLDALNLMRHHGAKTVNMSVVSPSGQGLVDSLLRQGHISGPIRTSETGKAEYHIGQPDIEKAMFPRWMP
jgi:hypothetical protein